MKRKINLSKNKKRKVLVVGDVMLDEFVTGSQFGNSPEAPVPLIKTIKKYASAGAAALVANSINNLGAESFLIGGIGKDIKGQELKSLIKKEKIHNFLIASNKSPTTYKKRIFSNSKPLLRVDTEKNFIFQKRKFNEIKKKIKIKMRASSVVVISDYGKGFCNNGLINFIIKFSNLENIPLLIDTRKKAKNFNIYKNSFCIKPNFNEAKSVYKNLKLNKRSLKKCALYIKKKYNIKNIIITLGFYGSVLLNEKNNFFHFKHKKRKNFDVTGAGDNFIASVAVMLSKRKNIEYACNISNFISGIAVEKFGTYAISKRTLSKEIKKNKFNEII